MTEIYKISPENLTEAQDMVRDAAELKLRIELFDPSSDPEYYCGAYADAWLTAHGSLANFSAAAYLNLAKKHYALDRSAVMRAYDGERPAGILDMDPKKEQDKDWGWVSFMYLSREYTHKGYGARLLETAEERSLSLGKHYLRLYVAESNRAARSFYGKHGFYAVEHEDNSNGRLWLMEKSII